MLVIERLTDSASIGHFGAAGHDEWWGSHSDALHFTEVVTHVRWLVVTTHLPYHGIAVLVVVPERVVAPFGGGGCRVDADVVGCSAHDDFLAPVTEDVALVARCTLGVVVRHRTLANVDRTPAPVFGYTSLCVLAIEVVEGLRAEVAVPVDAEVGVHASGIETWYSTVGHKADGAFTCRAPKSSGVVVAEVVGHGASVVVACLITVVYLAGCTVAVVVAGMVFVASVNLQAVDVGVEVTVVLGIAVAKAGGGKALSIVVDDHGTKAYLITSIHIHIGNAIVVIALSFPRTPVVVVPFPSHLEFVRGGIHIVSNHLVTGVDTACEEDARLASVEVGSAEEVLGAAVSVAVAPGCVEVGFSGLKTGERVGDALIGFASLSVHIDEVFSTIVHEPVGSTTCGTTVVFRGIAHCINGSVGHVDGGAVGSAHHSFGLAIAVPVVGHDVLLVVLEVAHVRSTIDPPEHCSVEFQTLEEAVLSVVSVAWITGGHLTLVVVFQQDFQFTVAIHIGAAGVVGNIGAFERLVVLGHDFQVTLSPYGSFLALCLLHTPYNGGHRVFVAGAARCVPVVRDVERSLGDFHTVAIDVVLNVVVFLAEDSPRQEHAVVQLLGNQSAVEPIDGALCKSRRR